MRFLNKIVGFGFTLASFVTQAEAMEDLVSSKLMDQALIWEQKDRPDIAAELWRKLLRADPWHPDALISLGLIEAKLGNINEVQVIYNRAKQLDNPPVGLKHLASVLGINHVVLKNPIESTGKYKIEKQNEPVTATQFVKDKEIRHTQETVKKSILKKLTRKNKRLGSNALPQTAGLDVREIVVIKKSRHVYLKSEALIDPSNLILQR